MRRLLNISLSSVPALIGAGICFLPMLWSKSIGTSSHCFYSTLSITIPVILIYSIWIPIYLLKRKTVFKIDAIDVLLCSYILFAALNTILHNKDINDAVITKWATFLSIYLTIRCLSNIKRILNVILYGLVCSALIQCIIFLVQKFLHSDVFFNPFSATAQFSNPGHLAAFLAVIFPLPLVLADQHTSKTIKWGFRISAALILASTLLTFSRGAFLAGFISFLLYLCTTKTKSSRIKKNLLIIIATAVVLSSFLIYYIRPKSADSRLLIWKVTAKEYIENPLLGKGTLSLSRDYMHLQADYFKSHPDSIFWTTADNNHQSFNETLHILYEQGLVGFVLILTAIMVWMKRQTYLYLRLAMVSLIVVSCFLYTSDIGPIFCLLPILIGTRYSECEESRAVENEKTRKKRTEPVLMTTLSLGLLLLSFFDVKNMKQAASYLRAFTKENISYSCINEKYKSIIEKDINFALILSKQIVRHGTSEESINVINRISEHTISTSDMICDLGDAYSFAGNYNKAQQAYTDAYYMVPGKITPLIKLFNLQRENNDISRAKLTAERILNNRYKVTGSLVVRSKNQAKHFINNLNYSNL